MCPPEAHHRGLAVLWQEIKLRSGSPSKAAHHRETQIVGRAGKAMADQEGIAVVIPAGDQAQRELPHPRSGPAHAETEQRVQAQAQTVLPIDEDGGLQWIGDASRTHLDPGEGPDGNGIHIGKRQTDPIRTDARSVVCGTTGGNRRTARGRPEHGRHVGADRRRGDARRRCHQSDLPPPCSHCSPPIDIAFTTPRSHRVRGGNRQESSRFTAGEIKIMPTHTDLRSLMPA